MVKYFAYGSNLYLKQMQDVLRRKNFYVEIVMLRDYELIFEIMVLLAMQQSKRETERRLLVCCIMFQLTKSDYLMI